MRDYNNMMPLTFDVHLLSSCGFSTIVDDNPLLDLSEQLVNGRGEQIWLATSAMIHPTTMAGRFMSTESRHKSSVAQLVAQQVRVAQPSIEATDR